MNTWIFQGNPNKFKIIEYLTDYEEIWWSIRQKHFVKDIQNGDIVYIWKADGGKPGTGGILARCEVIGEPIKYLPDENKYWIEPPQNPYYAARLKILEFDPENMLFRSELKSHKLLENLLIFRMANQTNYLLSVEYSKAIEELWHNKFPTLNQIFDVGQTEKEMILKIRTVQGAFRTKLLNKNSKCALCSTNEPKLLIASHIKPWRDCSNIERTDINNGLLLCPNHDALFDSGFITFDKDGRVLISNRINLATIAAMNIHTDSTILILNREMENYLKWHRKNVFL
ncbi:HNH endonuclease [Ureibacillus sp. MALMAid1270]|uniref:HNH endonuclease n=1 Tax=Ureibacillus sp. MALMAid1270 TaxID=3411629 RepID=UPI003BA45F12